MTMPFHRGLAAAVACALAAPPCLAQAAGADDAFTLGRLTVTGERLVSPVVGDDVIEREELWRFDTPTLVDAVKLVPGVTATQDTNGRRNEHDILIRGFGRWQVPLSIDGVRIYLPADNRLDFRRFLTADLAEIQVRKGYVSVVDGPGAMGGAINLVTRKPTRAFESQFQAGVDLGRDGRHDAWNGYASVGTRRERFYAHASVGYQDRKRWRLPGDYTPTSIQAAGARDRSASRDSRINLKLGFVPNATDEYTLSYTRQDGSKGAPLNVHNDPPNPRNSYWDWPTWDIGNLYFLSHTQLGETSFLKTRLFHNTFDNVLDAYDDDTYTTQSNNGRFRSVYDDEGYGGSVEFGFSPASGARTRLAAHWRSDRHAEYSLNRPTHPTLSSREPTQRSREDTWSLAAEHAWRAGEAVELMAGASYDRNEIKLAQDYDTARGVYAYPTGGSDAWNGQVAAFWTPQDGSRFGLSLSSRTRFPTSFERFSTRFGTALPNPDLSSERATQLELSWRREFSTDARLEAALFYADIADMIQTVIVDPDPQTTQTRNVGAGESYGVELGGQARVAETLVVGGHVTWLRRVIRDPLQPGYRPVGTPSHQALLYASWTPWAAWTFTPSLEYAGDRWSDGPGGGYLRTGRYTLAGLQVEWQARPDLRFAVGGRNLLDETYALAWGFPEEGRAFYAKMQVGF